MSLKLFLLKNLNHHVFNFISNNWKGMMKVRKAVIVDYLRSPFSRSRPREPERDKFNLLRMDHVTAL